MLSKDKFQDTVPDAATEEWVTSVRKTNEELLSKQVMTLPFTLDGKREHVRSGQTNLGSVVADAERAYSGADVAFTVGAFLRDNIAAGKVTRGALLKALPFSLPLVARDMTGAQLKVFLENNYAKKGQISGAWAHVSGMSFDVDYSRPAGDRMVKIMIDGTPLNASKTYLVACNEQVSDFGIRDIPVKKRWDVPMAELLIDYVGKRPDLKEPDTRVTVYPSTH